MVDLFGNEVFTGFRALTWKEPFATLMLKGKTLETRLWDTNFRGKTLLCMGMGQYNEAELLLLCGPEILERIKGLLEIETERMELMGMAYAIGDLVHTRPMRKEDEDKAFVKFNPSLFVHEYPNVQRIEPFIFKGAQGWTRLTQEQLNDIQLL